MTDICIRCGIAPASRQDWLHCDPCFQDVCDEVEQLRAAAADPDWYKDDIYRRMEADGIGFIEAVERLARERGL